MAEWYCDACGELIAGPGSGAMEMSVDTEGKRCGFRICHTRCLHDAPACSLRRMSGRDGMLSMLAMLGRPGEENRLCNLREWTTAFRRLHKPLFEEARSSAGERASEPVVSGEVSYRQRMLREVLDAYGPLNNARAPLPRLPSREFPVGTCDE